MNPTPLSKVAEFADAKLEAIDPNMLIDTISTDSRTIQPGQLFVALRGENFNAHDFVEAVAKTGAAGAIVEESWKGNVPNKFGLLRAEDTLRAYHSLAANYRRSL